MQESTKIQCNYIEGEIERLTKIIVTITENEIYNSSLKVIKFELHIRNDSINFGERYDVTEKDIAEHFTTLPNELITSYKEDLTKRIWKSNPEWVFEN